MAHEGLGSVFPLRALKFFTNQPADRHPRLSSRILKPYCQFLWKTDCDCMTHRLYCNTLLYDCFTIH